ncbi:hypothetical protein B0J11DRAFT_276216 [Dendryphion nanum]|uniref:Uncharacterized protein n=1 Tax=Dendryphion nanum TaxID=256645 RepID=A0A9P9IPW5_9PLEO|nr:hypothetical protein B0J11DRAFT_276216 [Dendryphion nanum]
MAFRTSTVGGPKTSWLAINYGCCASSSRRDSLDGDEGRLALRANGESEMRICYDQPQAVPQPRAEPVQPRPSTSHSMSKHVSQWVTSSRDFATRASSRASLHTLTRPRRSYSKPRPSIGMPMDFRHCDGADSIHGASMFDNVPMPVRRRRSFRPLELSIYLPDGRLSPLPDFDGEWDQLEVPERALVRQRDSWANSISSEPDTSTYLIQRKPVGSASRRSSVQSQTSVQSRPVSMTLSALPLFEEEEGPRSRPESPSLNRSNTFSSITSLASPSRLLSRLPSPSRSRSNTASSRPGSLRRTKTDIDEAIRELNTIVEEKRADAYRSQTHSPTKATGLPPSPSHHVPAIAPSRRMHVRTETLSDIGSVFSVPLATKPVSSPAYSPALYSATSATSAPSPASSRFLSARLTLSPPTRPHINPLTSNPITPTTPSIHTPTTPIQRIGAWIKRSLPTTPSSPPSSLPKSSAPNTPKPQSSSSANKPFYQCEPAFPQPTTFPNSIAQSRPSSAGSRTLHHGRQDSADTATVTLFSTTETARNSLPSTPALSIRSVSPTTPRQPETPATGTPLRTNLLKGEGKTRRVPKPLVLEKNISMGTLVVESPLPSARSIRSGRGLADLKPPPSPNYNLLRGMEMTVGKDRESVVSVSNVGVAF